MPEYSTRAYRMAFASLKGINRTLAVELLERCGSEKEFFELPAKALAAYCGRRTALCDAAYRNSLLEAALREEAFVEAGHVKTIYFTDPDYPKRLNEAVDAPLMLYGLGDADLNARAVISVVGTRHMTPYGAEFTERLIAALAERLTVKPLIVSGLAFGVDIAAHRAALQHGLPTAAVLAHGLNTIYPAQHRSTAARMVHEGGMLLTDYRSSDAIHKGNFLARNRIVAALCDCLVVVESAEKGGALVTANLAYGYSREVFALPGRIADRYSQGCNALIRRNIAQLITSADDLADAMNWPLRPVAGTATEQSLFPDLSDDEKAVYEHLAEKGEAMLNELSVAVGLPIGRLMGVLVDLEFKHLVVSIPGGRYRPAR